jgi:hypothetical protein
MELKNNPKLIWTILILISIGVILLSVYLIIYESKEAKKECNKINGEYKITFMKGHTCNGERFYKQSICKNIGNKLECRVVWGYENQDLNKEFY